MPSNDGTWLQDKLVKALTEFTQTYPAFFHRFPDTKSARNFLKNQPSDFLLSAYGSVFLVECKSTETDQSIIELAYHGDVGKRQIAKHRLWHRSGQPSLYLYGNISQGLRNATFSWHSGSDIVGKLDNPLVMGKLKNLLGSLQPVINMTKDK